MKNKFYFWLLDHQCHFKHDRFNPFIDNCIEDLNLFALETEREIYNYLWVNGYGEEVLLSFLKLWYCYSNSFLIE